MILDKGNFYSLMLNIDKNHHFLSSLTSLKESSIDLKFNPRHIAYCIEYFRNQLMKVDYLFSSLTLSTLSVSSTLDNLVIKSLTSIDLQLTHKDAQNNEDIIGIRR